MMGIVKTTTFNGTWLGRKGTNVTYHFDRNRLGKRVSVQTWDDSDEIEIHALKGSFWRGPAGHTFEKKTITDQVNVIGEVLVMAMRHDF